MRKSLRAMKHTRKDASKEIVINGQHAYYEGHELDFMRRLTARADLAKGKERSAILEEIRNIHALKAEFPGSRFLEDE